MSTMQALSFLDSQLDQEITKMSNAEAIYAIVNDIQESLPMLEELGIEMSKVYPTYYGLKSILDNDIKINRELLIDDMTIYVFSVPTPRLISQTVVGVTPHIEEYELPQLHLGHSDNALARKICREIQDNNIIMCNLDMAKLIIGCTLKNMYNMLSAWSGAKYVC